MHNLLCIQQNWLSYTYDFINNDIVSFFPFNDEHQKKSKMKLLNG